MCDRLSAEELDELLELLDVGLADRVAGLERDYDSGRLSLRELYEVLRSHPF